MMTIPSHPTHTTPIPTLNELIKTRDGKTERSKDGKTERRKDGKIKGQKDKGKGRGQGQRSKEGADCG